MWAVEREKRKTEEPIRILVYMISIDLHDICTAMTDLDASFLRRVNT